MVRELPPGLTHLFAQTKLYTDGEEYVIISLPVERQREAVTLFAQLYGLFGALLFDKDEVTLVVPWAVWEGVREALGGFEEARGYRLITFDLPLELGLVGYLATASSLLAEQGVSIYALSAYARDHILVREDEFDRAWAILSGFIARCQAALSESAG